MIATSREPLRVRGETVWRVPPLELPAAADELAPGELAAHEAIRLFADRAAAVRPGFALDAGNCAAVVRLCRTLDGMPLAIELAAARVGALSVEQIAARLGDRFQLLASGDRTAPVRQQTLRAAVDWSYELLTEPEQVLLRRLAVFSGWNLDMAEQVCGDEVIPPDRVLDLLAALIDKSLVTLDGELEGDARYRLLDTIREYAAGRLNSSGEAPQIRRRHRDYMLRLLTDITSVAFVRGDPPWPARVALYRRAVAERANCRAALVTCLEQGDTEEGLVLCTGLRSPWVAYGDASEGVGWFDKFLGLDGDVPPGVRARALMARAELAFEQQDYQATGERAQAGPGPVPRVRGRRRRHRAAHARSGQPAGRPLPGRPGPDRRGDGGRARGRRRLGGRARAGGPGHDPGPAGPPGRGPGRVHRGARRAAGQQRLGRGADPVRVRRAGPGARRARRRAAPLPGRAGAVPRDRRPAGDRPVPGRHRLGGAGPE